ncbi:two-component response regulator-like APRR9 [Wolffia australiana]
MTCQKWEIFCAQSSATDLEADVVAFPKNFEVFSRICRLIVESGGLRGEMEGEGGEIRDGLVGSSQKRRVIRWERFLPRRSLRVLLVEPDDSTRHIVTALLRKCSYQVASVADGVKAWDVVEKNYNFDLILSEVEVPSICGISLLSKIMGCELSRNIPVIMMSAQDSVSVVFKCMQKGAVDFLVKPVRKNELRNLWQHVWRRHCSIPYINEAENMDENQSVSENMSNNAKGERVDEGHDDRDDQSSGSKPLNHNESTRTRETPLEEGRKSPVGVLMSQPSEVEDEAATLVDESKMDDSYGRNDSSNPRAISGRTEPLNCLIKNGFQERDVLNHSPASAFSRYGNTGICILAQKPGSSLAAKKDQTHLNIHNSKKEKQRSDLQFTERGGKESMNCPQRQIVSMDASATGSRGDSATNYGHPHFGMLQFQFPVKAPIPFQNFCPSYGPLLQPMFFCEPSAAAIDEEAEERCRFDQEEEAGEGRPECVEQSGNCSWDDINGGGFGRIEALLNARTGLDCGAESMLQDCKGKDVDPGRSHREAALLKFRQKRKDRCFEKKVRYHSRKMLAEQRPRVKGQFVRQTIVESSEVSAEMDN